MDSTTVPDPFAEPLGSCGEPDMDEDEYRLKRLKKLAGELEVTALEIQQLRGLEGIDIVFLCDDSGSMNNTMRVDSRNLYGKSISRWEDLKQNVQLIIKFAMTLDADGIDIYFLNRDGAKGVKHWKDARDLFDAKPNGHTPLSNVLADIMDDKADSEKRVIIVIGTDGEPDDGRNLDNPRRFRALLKSRDTNKFYISILACSDDKQDIKYLEKLDSDIKHLDVSDDFETEKLEVLHKGKTNRFTRGDYVAKVLLGPILRNWHTIDGKADKKCVIC